MKYLLVLLVVAVAAWLLLFRRPRVKAPERPPEPPQKPPEPARIEPQKMLACAHCGVHLPAADAVPDAGGRPYCSEAHRLAGPR